MIGATNLPSLHKIRAAVLRPAGLPLEIESLEMEGPQDDEVLVRIVSTGICHTDIGFCASGGGEPVVLGHEGAGVVESVGRDVEGVGRGDHVVLSYQSCGSCEACRRGRPADCSRFVEANFGFARLDGSNALGRSGVRGHFFGQSSFSTFSLATMRNLVKVPDDLDLSLLAPLGCGFQTGAGTVMNSLNVPQGASIAVFGTGAVGIAAIMAARIVGADPIIGVDINPQRLEIARELGATHIIDPHHSPLLSRISGITGSGVDFVVETTGDWEMSRIAVRALNRKGIAGFLAGGSTRLLSGGRQAKSIIQGDAVPQRFIPRLISFYRAGRFPFDRLIRFYPFREINKAIADAEQGNIIKPVLRISDP